ncbi:MAG: hypothetical protein WBL25_18815 [Anaerolineales bacterium]
MKKILKVIGVILLLVIIMGVMYLLSSTKMASIANPGSLFGQLIGGVRDALNGIQASISRMFGNFTK